MPPQDSNESHPTSSPSALIDALRRSTMSRPVSPPNDWIDRIREDDYEAFEMFFRALDPALLQFVVSQIRNTSAAEEIVQDLFFDLWKRRTELQITGTLRAYLYRAARNKSLNFIRHRSFVRRREVPEAVLDEIPAPMQDSGDQLHADALVDALNGLIEELPERRRIIYLLIRKHGFSYAETASALDISVKTVEAQMSAASRLIRDRLSILLAM